MVDWRQIHLLVELGLSRKFLGRGLQKIDGIRLQHSVEKQGIWGFKLIDTTAPSDKSLGINVSIIDQ